jgi:ElaB/YqjD/DUF883 family membrane-anchored ribosome-binding protein
MKKSQGKKVKKALTKISKKTANSAKKKARQSKGRVSNLLGRTRKKLNAIRKKSTKTLSHAKDKIYATEKEVLEYVKQNPVKSMSAVALAGLITGFLSRFKK